jgi:O-antigen ligase
VDGQLWGRYAGTLRHPNKFGYYLTLTSILTFHKIIRSFSRRKKLAWALFSFALMIQALGIYLSGSMTAYIGILVGLFLILFSYLYTDNQLLSLAIGLSALALILVICLFLGNFDILDFSGFKSTLLGLSAQRVFTETGLSRLEIYQDASASIIKHPFIGVGYDQISTSGITGETRKLSGSIHNVLLQVWYVGGLFSFLGWLLIYCRIGAQALKNLFHTFDCVPRSLICAISSAALAAIVMDQFQDPIYQREKWLVFGLLLAIVSLKKRQTGWNKSQNDLP